MDTRKLRGALRKQGICVHESDPILDIAAICDAAMTDALTAIEGVVKAAADCASAAAAQTVEASKTAGEAIINQGAALPGRAVPGGRARDRGSDSGRVAAGGREG
jgi:hypothetical protein